MIWKLLNQKYLILQKKRLKLSDDWHIYDSKEREENEAQIETVGDVEDIYEGMLDFELEDLHVSELKYDDEANDELESFVSKFLNQGLFITHQLNTEIMRTRHLFLFIKRFKYSLLCTQITDNLKINTLTLNFLMKIYKNQNIYYSLIALYDDTYLTINDPSPTIATFKINTNFDKKFF